MENSTSLPVYDLLLMACSRRKHDDKFIRDRATQELRPLTALERYDGPTFRSLKSWVDLHTPPPHAMPKSLLVYILSGKFGLLWYNTPTPYYDQKMTRTSAAQMSGRVLRQLQAMVMNSPRRIMFVGPQEPYGRMLHNLDKMFRGAEVTMNIARIGIQCHNLLVWLKGVEL